MRLAELAQLCGAQLLQGNPEQQSARISIDSRTLGAGDCFVALRGPRFDGHEFVAEAARSGASAAVVSNPTRAMNSPTPNSFGVLQVQDTLTALHTLASNYRRLMPPTTRLIAISGASGKTTTKEMIAAVLAERFHLTKTPANQNNHIGVPLSVLGLESHHDFGVFELGSNHPGEMQVLAEMVRADIGVVTNIGLAHVEFFGDEAGVAREEGVPLEYLPRNGDGLAVLNADDRWCASLRARTRATVVTVGINNFADIRASEIRLNGDVKFRLNIARKREDVVVRLRTLGRHQIYNALQAAAVGYFAGMDLDEIRLGLESFTPPPLRMQVVDQAGVRFVNDSYNANVPSMTAALQMLAETPCAGRKIAVLGEMLELGSWTRPAHAEMGTRAAAAGLAFLVVVGASAAVLADAAVSAGLEVHRVFRVPDTDAAAIAVRSLARAGDLVLLKGSRRLRLERILEADPAEPAPPVGVTGPGTERTI
ncbi:UDP-N-acetylmuramoyl-tripeptide--D-alanyl-D-alanine ligase [bacterium]|nr:UDP-N-acetylmuramoyl-tripeptide--D-alanyl-D-alanine ligase [bacterium]